jgi:hypothetical protein
VIDRRGNVVVLARSLRLILAQRLREGVYVRRLDAFHTLVAQPMPSRVTGVKKILPFPTRGRTQEDSPHCKAAVDRKSLTTKQIRIWIPMAL